MDINIDYEEPSYFAGTNMCRIRNNGTPCTQVADQHVILRSTFEGFFATLMCPDHLGVYEGPYLKSHNVGSDCDMPGIQWNSITNACFIPN